MFVIVALTLVSRHTFSGDKHKDLDRTFQAIIVTCVNKLRSKEHKHFLHPRCCCGESKIQEHSQRSGAKQFHTFFVSNEAKIQSCLKHQTDLIFVSRHSFWFIFRCS